MTDSAIRFHHDDLVQKKALQLLADGWRVKARVEGWFEEPDSINGYRPDIVARRGDITLVIEVKKGDVDFPKIIALQAARDTDKFLFELLDAQNLQSEWKIPQANLA